MSDEPLGFTVAFNESLNYWYVIHKQMKGDVLHRTILEPTYDTEEEAQAAAENLGAGSIV